GDDLLCEGVRSGKDLRPSPPFLCNDLLVEPDPALAQLISFDEEGTVAQLRVVPGKGKVTERMNQSFMNLDEALLPLKILTQHLAPLGSRALRHHMLDGEWLRLHRFLVTVRLLQPLEYQFALGRPPMQIERHGAHR